MKIFGLSLTLGSLEDGNWADDDRRIYTFRGWGLRVNLACGPIFRPIPKFWRYRLFGNHASAPNPWKNPDDVWFTIKLPFFVGPYVSFFIRRFGMYLGLKEDGDGFLVPSARITFRRRF